MIGSVEPLIINDVEELEEFHEIPAVSVFQMRAYIGVPIILADGCVYGTLCALDRSPQRKTQRDVDTLLILARLLASQIDRQELGAIEERQRIAREIHDTIAQSLAGLVLDLSIQTVRLNEEAPALAPESQRMQDAARQALREIRRSIWNLQPAVLEGRTIAQAIGEELRQLLKTGIDASIEVRGQSSPLPPPTETALVRIAREALSNVQKHSMASQVIVTIEYLPDDIVLRIDDDGLGIDGDRIGPATVDAGFGMRSMRERARLAGGELRIEPRPAGGTSLICRVPRESTGQTGPGTTVPAPVAARSKRPIRLGIVDDHTIVREGLKRLLERAEDLQIACEARDTESALPVLERERPDVILLDLQMPGIGGIGCLERLATAGLSTRAIVLTTYAQDEPVFQAIRLGARGYLLKDASPDDLIGAIRTVAAGGTLIAPAVAGRLAERVHHADTLTPREREVLALVGDGLRNKEIAFQLGTSEKTVQFHLANLFSKLGAGSRTEATRIAIDRGLISTLSR